MIFSDVIPATGLTAVYAPLSVNRLHVMHQIADQLGRCVLLDELNAPYFPETVLTVIRKSVRMTKPALKAVIIDPPDCLLCKKHDDYSWLNRIANSFKVAILFAPLAQTDAIDFAAETLIAFSVSTIADDDAPYGFKVFTRSAPHFRGYAAINPASGFWEVSKQGNINVT